MSMRPLYALTFQLDDDRLKDLVQEIRRWIASKYAGWDQVFPTDGTPLDLGKPAHRAELNKKTLPSGRVFSFTLSHPDRRTDGLFWHTSLTGATDGEETECEVVLSTYVTRDGVQPPDPSQIHPPFIRRIAGKYALRVENEPLALKPKTADIQDVGDLVDILLMPQRRLPLILVSDETGGGPLVDPASLQNRLLGTARVVRITPRASYELSNKLDNKRLSCFDGGVRIYWPGFQLGDDKYFHKLYLKWEIRELESSGRSLADDIFDRITSNTSIRLQRGPLLQKLREAQEKAKEVELRRRIAEIGKRETVTKEDKEAYEELLSEASEEKDKLLEERRLLRNEVEMKSREADELRWKLRAAREALNGVQKEDEDDDPNILLKMSEQARQVYDEHAARQPSFDRLLTRLTDPVMRDNSAARCPGGGYVYPRTDTDERIFFEMHEGVVFVCTLFPNHQDSLAKPYNDLRQNGVSIDDFDGFEPWKQSEP